ncbi:MAG: PepSY-associated TM helix domain-containing protein [Longimicrobiales bacterium]|nr:PepSY-associated TM helix domain-containing protein [Longimicrobiales bacterium]
MFHTHLWIGVLSAALVIVVSVTGILLNHKRTFGLMPDVAGVEAGLEGALPLADVVRAAEGAVGNAVAAGGVDRIDVRPDDGLAKVRFADRLVTEATVALRTGEVLHVGERNDVFLEKLHSGEIFGDRWTLLSDALAVGLLILLLSGTWMWLYPKARM